MQTFKHQVGNGIESRLNRNWVDADGKSWPVYRKKLAIANLANAGTTIIAHGVPEIKLNGYFHVTSLYTSNAGNTNRTNLFDSRITNIALIDAASIAIANTADLTTQSGSIEIEYCKTTD